MPDRFYGAAWVMSGPQPEQHWENWLYIIVPLLLLFGALVLFALAWAAVEKVKELLDRREKPGGAYTARQAELRAEEERGLAEERAKREAGRKAEVEREKERIEAKAVEVRALGRELLLHQVKGESEGSIRLGAAVRSGLVEVGALRGLDLEEAVLSLRRGGEPDEKICIPLGMTLVSSGRHQTMTVRRDHVVRLPQHFEEVRVPVACLNFHKKVPTPSDSFTGIGDASPLIKLMLAVADAADVGPFITQLAVWAATDEINPTTVAIRRAEPTGSFRDENRSEVVRPSRFDIAVTVEILKKTAELYEQLKNDPALAAPRQ